MKFREAKKVDRKSGGSPIKGLSFFSTRLPAVAGEYFVVGAIHTLEH